ncbi:hypothetical protein [Soonwooa buanensis]|uniref:hypothetical protein n=1 Tax=Soonwooa buanensis TaxID=619805 RepID=UPI0009A79FA9|nr:hypothetical protein [Soonwooa buanensis]
MIIYRSLFFIFLCLTQLFVCQSKTDFDALYNQSYNKLYQNPDECIVLTQSNLLNVQNTDNFLSLQQIMGQAYMMKGEFVQSIRLSL